MNPRSQVLLVDDQESSRAVLAAMLIGEDLELVQAESGREALAIARSAPPDLILLDVLMPDIDGFEVCRTLRRDADLSQIPIILITGLDDPQAKLEGLSAGADELLTKPVDRAELVARLRTITRLNRYRQLRDEKERLEGLIDLSPDGICVVDEAGTIRHANRAMARLSGVAAASDLVSASLGDWLDRESAPKLRRLVERVLASGSATEAVEVVLRDETTEGRAAEVKAGPCTWDRQPAVQLLVRDITSRRRLEAEVRHRRRLEAMGQAAAQIVHDFDAYLDAIRLQLQLLEPEIDIAPVLEAVESAADLGRRLLLFARKDAGAVSRLDLVAMVTGIRPILDRQLKAHDQRLDLPRAPLWIVANEVSMQQLLLNLVSNAAEASEPGRPVTLRVRRGAARRRGHAVIEVEDRGAGIAPEIRQQIFEPFFTTRRHGTGLGLATVYGVVRRAGGSIEIHDRPGGGTTFRVLIPLAPDEP
ncbi:MAG: response regulator [Acidobacteriota bacterium]